MTDNVIIIMLYFKALKTNIKNTLYSFHFPTADKANRCKNGMSEAGGKFV